jgi:hypothetical protein
MVVAPRKGSGRKLFLRPTFLSVVCIWWAVILVLLYWELPGSEGQQDVTLVAFWKGIHFSTIEERLSKALLVGNLQEIASTRQDVRIIVFLGDKLGMQGAGNIMLGLLGAHLLADEFRRVVCVTPAYVSFNMAFEALQNKDVCQRLFQAYPVDSPQYLALDQKRLVIVNYDSQPPDECAIQKRLSNRDEKVVFIMGNAYPRWCNVPDNYFYRFYQPKQEILKLLPYNVKKPPITVVHLRLEDGVMDKRKGLDNESLKALGELLLKSPSSQDPPFLVTNNVLWFVFFEHYYGWMHPKYEQVVYSVRVKSWGGIRHHPTKPEDLTPNQKKQYLQLWSDWFTILTAKQVYHTHSDFSTSAVLWMGTSLVAKKGAADTTNIFRSRVIDGIDIETGNLRLAEEPWIGHYPAERLVDRSADALQHCHIHK